MILDYSSTRPRPHSGDRNGQERGSRTCAIGRKVLRQNRQRACKGNETAIGQAAYDAGTEAVKKLFGKNLKILNLDYVEATEALADEDESATGSSFEAYVGAPAIIRADQREVRLARTSTGRVPS